jgi:hypothetical protein
MCEGVSLHVHINMCEGVSLHVHINMCEGVSLRARMNTYGVRARTHVRLRGSSHARERVFR